MPFNHEHDDDRVEQAIRASGEIFGIKDLLSHSLPLMQMTEKRVTIPAIKGMPK